MNNDNYRAMVEWQAVPKIANGLVVDTIRTQLGCDTSVAQEFWSKLLFWATEYPADIATTEQPETCGFCGKEGKHGLEGCPAMTPDTFTLAEKPGSSVQGKAPLSPNSGVWTSLEIILAAGQLLKDKDPLMAADIIGHVQQIVDALEPLTTPPPAPAAEQGEIATFADQLDADIAAATQPEARGATAPKYSDEELLTAKELLASFTPSYRAALFAAAAAPGFDDIAVHCQQAGCQFLNPLPEPVRVDDVTIERMLASMRGYDCFMFFSDHTLRGCIHVWLTAALATDGGKEESNGK